MYILHTSAIAQQEIMSVSNFCMVLLQIHIKHVSHPLSLSIHYIDIVWCKNNNLWLKAHCIIFLQWCYTISCKWMLYPLPAVYYDPLIFSKYLFTLVSAWSYSLHLLRFLYPFIHYPSPTANYLSLDTFSINHSPHYALHFIMLFPCFWGHCCSLDTA